MAKPVADRFWAKVQKTDGCWYWLAYCSKEGYGNFWNGEKTPTGHNHIVPAHRWSYEHVHGKIAPGLVIDHLCRVRNCVRPDHLEAVTDQVNIARGIKFNSLKDYCRNGHPLSGKNLYTCPRGKRECRICRSAAVRRSAEKRKNSIG